MRKRRNGGGRRRWKRRGGIGRICLGEDSLGDSRAGLKPSFYSGDLVMEIRRFGVQDAEALWRLRMIALQTDPWSFAESVEELRQISVEEYGRRIGSGGDGSFVIGAFEGDVPVGMCGFYRETLLKRRHKAHLWGVFVAPAARGKRLGLDAGCACD